MGLVTCARVILRCLKEPQTPTLNIWKLQVMETAACEKMLARLNGKNNIINEQWTDFSQYIPGESNLTR